MGKNRSRASGASQGGFDQATANGYSGNGLSLFTRRAAKAQQDTMFAHATPARISKGKKLKSKNLIEEYMGRVRWLEAELHTETDKTRRDKLTKQLEIKRRRLDELRRELFLEQR
jgi:hypothetical protein